MRAAIRRVPVFAPCHYVNELRHSREMTLFCLPKVTEHHSQVNWFLTLVNAVLAQGKECLPKSRNTVHQRCGDP